MAGWRTRGYIPHIEAAGTPQFLTIRLFDSLPIEVLEAWESELAGMAESQMRKEMMRRMGAYLDAGHGCCLLRNPIAGRIVQDCLIFHHGSRYGLHAWSVMPNHVHIVLTPYDDVTLGKIFHTLKGFTVHQINRELGRTGELWQEEYYDTVVKSEAAMQRVRWYTEWNPVKAKLCADPSHWPWSSANPVARERVERKGR